MDGDKPYDEDEKPRSPSPGQPPPRSETPAQAPIAPTLAAGSATPPPPPAFAGVDAGLEQTLPAADPIDTREVESGQYFVRGSEIARGGMGRILRAHDVRLGRPVAIKELLSSSPDMERRFEREIQITARLQHPAIIAVYEAGRLPSGLPFFSMKEVEGKPFDKVISATQSMKDRLALLPSVIAVADALSYAHDRHIIHRDLKPANVLVGDYGETVVIDWGLAKDLRASEAQKQVVVAEDLDADGALTVIGEAMGTPAYMSPRQARGESVDQRADVYSLGAMLYHLLSGQMPYTDQKPKSISELLALVKNEAPTPLSELTPDVPSDLLAVVDRAMARETADRYTRAADLAADLRRFQNGQRVGVHQYTPRQLVGRWLRRHLAVVSVAGSVVVVAGVILVASAYRYSEQILSEKRKAQVERDLAEENQARAEEHRAKVEGMLSFLSDDLAAKLKLIGRTELLDMVARQAASYYEQRPIDWIRPEEVGRRAAAFTNLGDVLLEQGNLDAALERYRKSKAIRERLAQEDPGNAHWQRSLAESYGKVGNILFEKGDGEGSDALEAYQASQAIHERLVQDAPRNAGRQLDLAVSSSKVGDIRLGQGSLGEALTQYQASLTIAEELAQGDPKNAQWQHSLAYSYNKVGDVLEVQGKLDEALENYQRSMVIRERLAGEKPNNAGWQRDLSVGYIKVGNVRLLQGGLVEALQEYSKALAIREGLTQQDPKNANWQRDLSNSYHKVGSVHEHQGNAGLALEQYRKALAIRERLVHKDPTNAIWQSGLAGTYLGMARVLKSRGESEAAGKFFVKCSESYTAYASKTNDFYNAASCYALMGDINQAFDWLDKAADQKLLDATSMNKDKDLASLRSNPRWKTLIERVERR